MRTIDMLCLMILIALALSRLEKRVGARLDRIGRRFDALQEQRCNTTDAPQETRTAADGWEKSGQ